MLRNNYYIHAIFLHSTILQIKNLHIWKIMNDSNKILILFTDEFPYASGKTFIENEIKHLSENFERV